MIGILVVAHAPLGHAFCEVLTHIFGQLPEALSYIDVTPQTEAQLPLAIAQALTQLDQGAGVLVMTDVLGATPCNILLQALESHLVACIAGTNLPMLLRAIHYRSEPLADMVERTLEGGHLSILPIYPPRPLIFS